MQLLLRNAMQIKALVEATFSATDFDSPKGCTNPPTDADMLACKWEYALEKVKEYKRTGKGVEPSILALAEVWTPHIKSKYSPSQFCQRAQRVMSGAASNYDIPRMATGIALAAVAFISSALEAIRRFSSKNVDVLIVLTLNVVYGIMMFASSYVEEEQHFWYWAAAGWLVYLRARW
jgi:ethanolaminephosphotransferase